MKPRQDLLDLSLNALTAIANAGFVKRAQKDLAAGGGPDIRQTEDLDLQAEFADGTLTRLNANQHIVDADCNCSASSMCRHKVMLVLAYQALHQTTTTAEEDSGEQLGRASEDATYWSPADFSDSLIAHHFSDSVQNLALSLTQENCLAQVLPARLQADGKSYSDPAVQLAMNHVRFFSRSSPALARCDCQQASGCSHIVQALWAFRQASRQLGAENLAQTSVCKLELRAYGELAEQADATTSRHLLTSDSAQLAQTELDDFLWRLWLHGSGQNLTVLEIHYQNLLHQLQQLGWLWPSLTLQAIWQQVLAQAARSSRYDSQLLLGLVSQCHNRLRAAHCLASQTQPCLPVSQVLGLGQAGEVALDSLRLISLGAEFWYDQAEIGASLVYADSDTQVISVLEKSWPLGAGDMVNAELILNKRLANFPLRQLAAGQIISKAAKRRANAQLELSSNHKLSSILPLSSKSWAHLREPLKWADLAALGRYLQQGLPDFVSEFQAQANYRVIELEQLELQRYYWQGAEQTLCMIWQDTQGLQLHVNVSHTALNETAVDQASSALAGAFGAILGFAGPVELRQGHLYMQARSMLCAERALVFAVPTKALAKTNLSDFSAAPALGAEVLQQTRWELAQLLRSGLLSSNHHARRRLTDMLSNLRQHGYTELAERLQQALALLNLSSQEQREFLRLSAEFDALLQQIQSQSDSSISQLTTE